MFEAKGIEISFEIAGEVQLRRRLQGIINHARNMEPVLSKVALDFWAHMATVFDSQGGATASGSWAPLSDRYAAWKMRNYPGQPILQLRGKLKASLTPSGEGRIFEQTADSLTMGSGVRVGRWNLGMLHQTGTKNMPKRKIVDLPKTVKTRWVRYLREWLWEEK